jgi:hypothetical protein
MKGDSCLSNAEFVHYWEIQQFSFAVALSLAKKKYIFNPRCMEKLIGRCSGFQLQCAILIFFWNSSSRSSADIETWDIDIPLHHDA